MTLQIWETIRQACRLTGARPRDWRGYTVEELLDSVGGSGVRVCWGCFTRSELDYTL